MYVCMCVSVCVCVLYAERYHTRSLHAPQTGQSQYNIAHTRRVCVFAHGGGDDDSGGGGGGGVGGGDSSGVGVCGV